MDTILINILTVQKQLQQPAVVISLHLWLLDLLVWLKATGLGSQAYADNLVIMIRGSLVLTISERTQIALNLVSNCCQNKRLNKIPGEKLLKLIKLLITKVNLSAKDFKGPIVEVTKISVTQPGRIEQSFYK